MLSGVAAAHLQGLVKEAPPLPCVAAPTKRHVDGVQTKRSVSRALAVICRGVPVTPPAWTLVDIAADLDEQRLGQACHEAGVRYGTTPSDVEAVLERQPSAAGAGRLRRIVSGETPITLSRLEAVFVRRLRAAGLPLPVTNRPAGSRRVDCRWREERLTVELDSYRYHSSQHAWERDRHREREAYARGDDFRRYTRDDVLVQPRLMLAELRELLRP